MNNYEKAKAKNKEAEFLLELADSEVERARLAKKNNNSDEADEALRNAELIVKRAKKLMDEAKSYRQELQALQIDKILDAFEITLKNALTTLPYK